MKYKIQRLYFRGGRRTINTGLTLEQAQAHCSDPEQAHAHAARLPTSAAHINAAHGSIHTWSNST